MATVLNEFLANDGTTMNWATFPTPGQTATANIGQHKIKSEGAPVITNGIEASEVGKLAELIPIVPTLQVGEKVFEASVWAYCAAPTAEIDAKFGFLHPFNKTANIATTTKAWKAANATKAQAETLTQAALAELVLFCEVLKAAGATKVYSLYLELETELKAQRRIYICQAVPRAAVR